MNGREVDLEEALERVRAAAVRRGATQFETITAAALAAFAAAGVEAAVVEAGLGGRHDATNVLRSRVVLLTNVGLEHTDVLGDTVAAIAREKLAVVHDENTIVVLPDDTFASLVPAGRIVRGGAREAAEAFVGHPIAAEPRRPPSRPARATAGRGAGRRPQSRRRSRGSASGYRRPTTRSSRRFSATRTSTRCSPCSRALDERFVATPSTNARALPAAELAARARRALRHDRGRRGPGRRAPARARARRAGARDGLALSPRRSRARGRASDEPPLPHARADQRRRRFALLVVAAIVGIAFAAGYILGKLLL